MDEVNEQAAAESSSQNVNEQAAADESSSQNVNEQAAASEFSWEEIGKKLNPYFSQKVRSLTPEALQNEGLNRALASKHKRQCVDLPRLKIIIN